MLRVRLLTVEDKKPWEIYNKVYEELSRWLFVEKGLIHLEEVKKEEKPWVTNLEDWRKVIETLIGDYDLIFCTVDLKIPRDASEDLPEAGNGFSIVEDILTKYRGKVRCCVLTGVAETDLESYLRDRGENRYEVPFEFKDDESQGVRGMVTHVKSQVLAKMNTLAFTDPEETARLVLLEESSGAIKDYFLSKAPYYSEPAGWRIPTLLIGDTGLGVRSFVAFVAFLAEAEMETIDLRPDSSETNFLNYERLCGLRDEMRQPQSQPGFKKKLLYIAGLAGYQPSRHAWHDTNCFEPLRDIIEILSVTNGEDAPVFGLVFRIYAESRFHIKDRDTRGFLRWLEEKLNLMTGVPLQYLGIDEFGWPMGHPQILRFPSLDQRGDNFSQRVSDAVLEHLSEEHMGDMFKNSITLSPELQDFLLEKTEWPAMGNLAGLVRVLRDCFENFSANRAEHQFEITKNHLPDDFREHFERIILNVDNVSLSYPTKDGGVIEVIEFADFSVEEGEVLVILGPSGCGKSSVLKLLSGLVQPTAGHVFFQGQPLKGPSSKIGMVFQDYSLFPWLTVQQNVAFGPRNRGEAPEEVSMRVNELLKISNLSEFRNAYPGQLSGGMRQRVAIVRTMANESDALLMDEPFGALDLQTRWQMQEFLLKTRQRTQTTVVFVTHDIDEAVFLADRIYVASPRPLTLGDCFSIPFSFEARNVSLRHDRYFVEWVDRVRESILAAAEKK